MFRMLRNLALAVAGFLSLLVIAVVIATTFIDPNTYKPRIEQLVQEHTHLELQLGGDLEWSLIPLGLELNDVQTRLGGEPFVSMRTLIAQVDFWSVLRMQPAVNTVLLDGLDAQLVRHKDGTGNWEQVLKASPDVRKEAADTSAPAESTTSAQPLPINIQQIRIADSRVSLQDAQSGQSIALDSLNLDVVGIDVDGAIGVDSVRLFGANLGVSDTAQGLELRL
ncbi:MAG: AsmA family protein, partial [Gammaproteobacteria bacterium]|nr:AsmA family protein [Gammaproteobacteria bacterium]